MTEPQPFDVFWENLTVHAKKFAAGAQRAQKEIDEILRKAATGPAGGTDGTEDVDGPSGSTFSYCARCGGPLDDEERAHGYYVHNACLRSRSRS